MALAHVENTAELVDFASSVKRNLRTLLGMREITAKALGEAVGLSEAQFSQRMSGSTPWKAHELDRIARRLLVTPTVVYAPTADDFTEALSRMTCFSIGPAQELEEGVYGLSLFDPDDVTDTWNRAPVLAGVSD